MYYYNSKPTELEAMLIEFLEFSKTREPQSNKIQKSSVREKSVSPDIGKGWPHYKGYVDSLASDTKCGSCACEAGRAEIPPISEQGVAAILSYTPITTHTPATIASNEASINHPPIESQASNPPPADFPNPIGYSGPERHAKKEYDLDYAHHLMSDISASIMPHVVDVINEQEFSGSPIFEGYLYRERLNQMVDDVLRRTAAVSAEAAEIMLSACECPSWQRRQLLRAVAESLLISELFFRRRPIYRKLIESGWNPSGIL
ncbi:MAG: hypothetical protein FWE20_03770 [Defluviitaleaceae bacterium]|nr:hypothetical protein [Defluviitaleaceae bacterium]